MSQSEIADVYGRITDLLMEGDLAGCDSVLAGVPVDDTDCDILLSYIIATRSVPTSGLPSRPAFFRAVRDRIAREWGETETAEIMDRYA